MALNESTTLIIIENLPRQVSLPGQGPLEIQLPLLPDFPCWAPAKLFNNFLSILHYFDGQAVEITHKKENHDVLSRFRSKIPTDRLLLHNFRRLTTAALDLVVHMLSFEPYLSTPSLSKHVAQNSAYFFRLCFASFFRLSRAQNERYEAETISNNQPDAGEHVDVLTVGFGG